MNRNVLLLVLAIVAFILAAIAGADADGEAVFTAITWVGVGGAFLSAAHLP